MKQVFELYLMKFKELKGAKQEASIIIFVRKKNKHLNNAKEYFLGGVGCGRGQFFADFHLLQGVLDHNTLERRGMNVFNTKFDNELCSEILSLF
jgi:hypothetical protein